MHELSIAESIVKAVEAEVINAGGGKVSSIHLEIGDLSTLEADSLSFCFEIVSKDTSMESAKLVIEKVKGQAKCSACSALFSVSNYGEPCPQCQSIGFDLLSGREMKITQIELED